MEESKSVAGNWLCAAGYNTPVSTWFLTKEIISNY